MILLSPFQWYDGPADKAISDLIIADACSATAYTVAVVCARFKFRQNITEIMMLTLGVCCNLQRSNAQIDDSDVLCPVHAQVRVHDTIHLPRKHAERARCILCLLSDNYLRLWMETRTERRT